MDVLAHVLDNRFFQLLAWPLIHFLWQACVIAVLVYAGLKLINNRHSKLRYCLCLLALLLCLFSPFATYLTIESEIQINEVVSVQELTLVETHLQNMTTTSSAPLLNQWLDYTPLLSLLWLIGVCFFSVALLLQMYHTYQLPKMNTIAPSIELQQLFSNLIQKFRANRHSRLLISMTAEVPMVIGWIKPVVLLPLSMSSGLSLQQVEMLLAHEIAHIKRYDYLVNFLQTLVEVVFFFHPAVHWISKQVRAEREYCCDDAALSCCNNPLAYANTLTQAEMLRPHHIPTLAMAASGGDLKNRILRVVDHQCTPKNTFNSDALVAVVVLSLLSSAFYNQKNHDPELNLPTLTSIDTAPNDQLEPIGTFDSPIEPTAPLANTNHSEQRKVNHSISTPRLAAQSIHSDTEESFSPVAQLTATQGIKETALENESPTPVNQVDSSPSTEMLITTRPVSIDAEPEKNSNVILTQNTAHSSVSVTPPPSPQAEPTLPALEKIEPPILTTTNTPSSAVLKPQQPKEIVAKKPLPKLNENSAPELIHSLPVETPKIGFRRKDRVSVQVTFTVDTQGNVNGFEFENGALAFRKAIKESVVDWQFKPAVTDGQFVAARVTREFIFTKPEFYDDLPTTGTRIKRY